MTNRCTLFPEIDTIKRGKNDMPVSFFNSEMPEHSYNVYEYDCDY